MNNLLNLNGENSLLLIITVNLVLSIIGIIFTYGAEVKNEKRQEKKYWILLWACIILYYFSEFLMLSGLVFYPNWIHLIIIDSGTIITFFIIIAYLNWQSKIRKVHYIALGLFFILTWILEETILSNNLFSLIIAAISMIVLAYIHRLKDLTKSLVMLTYGFAQIPIFFIDNSLDSINSRAGFLAALIPLKIILISVIYSYLGVKEHLEEIKTSREQVK